MARCRNSLNFRFRPVADICRVGVFRRSNHVNYAGKSYHHKSINGKDSAGWALGARPTLTKDIRAEIAQTGVNNECGNGSS